MKIRNRLNQPLRIGITGRMGSGKTTIGKIILNLRKNTEIYSIGQKIKQIVFELDLPFERSVLQNTGDFFRTYDNLVWVKYVSRQIKKEKKFGAIVDDIRYKVEGEFLRKQGFIIVRAITSEKLRRNRISEREKMLISDSNWENWNNHKNELETDTMEADFEIINDGDFKKLSDEVLKFINSIDKKSRSLYDFIKSN